MTGTLGGPIRFTARLSDRVAWVVTVRDQTRGRPLRAGPGSGPTSIGPGTPPPRPRVRYTWTISSPQMRSAAGTIGTAPGPLALQQLKLAPAIVTPNGDGRGDSTTITYRLTAPALVTASVGRQLRGRPRQRSSRQRKAAGTQSFVWSSAALPDGRYRLVLAAKDDRGEAGADDAADLGRPRRWRRPRRALQRRLAERRRPTRHLALLVPLNAPAHVQLRIRAPARWSRPAVRRPISRSARSGSTGTESGLRDGRYSWRSWSRRTRSSRSSSPSSVRVGYQGAGRCGSPRSGCWRFWLSEPGRLTVVAERARPCS